MSTKVSLARLYRPKSFADLVGQKELVQSLTAAIKRDSVPQAILLHGIRGTGKTTTARIIAKSLNCLGADGSNTKPTAEVCDVCASCVAINKDQHLDVVEIDAASNTGVDDMREIIESSRYKAVQGRFKVFIVDEVHMLSKSAFNALLKTLEEPPAHVRFIFATTEIKKIPATVLSRCMRFDLNKMTVIDTSQRIQYIAKSEKFEVEEDAISYLFRASEGSMRDALSLLDQALLLTQAANSNKITAKTVQDMLGSCDQMTVLAILEHAFRGQVDDVMIKVRQLFKEGYEANLLLQDLLHAMYWLICYKATPTLAHDPSWPKEERDFAKKFTTDITTANLLQAWQILNKSYTDISLSPIPELALEVLLVRFCYLKDFADLDRLKKVLIGQDLTAMLPSATNSTIEQGSQVKKKSFEDELIAKDLTANKSIKNEPIVFPKITSKETLKPKFLLENFEQLLNLTQEKKEVMMHSNLLHDVEAVNFKPCYISCRINDHVPKDFVKQLTVFLEIQTGQKWQIDAETVDKVQSLKQNEKDAIRLKEDESLNHPKVQELKELFPGADIQIQK